MRECFLALLSLLLAACALPVAEIDHQEFVPNRDLSAVSLAREGTAYYQKSRFVEAEFSFRKALYLYPNAKNVKANLASALRASGQYDEAEDILIALNAGAPKSIEYLGSLARLYVEKGDYAAARRYFTQAYEVALEKEDFASAARFARSLSVLAFRIGDEPAALCQSALASTLSADAENTARHARLLLASHQTDKAQALTNSYLNQPGVARDPAVQHELGMAQFAMANYKEAQDSERAVLETSDLDKSVQAEAELIMALSRRHLKEGEGAAVDTSVANSKTADPLASDLSNVIGTAIAAAPEKASLYWPLPLVEQVAAINAEKSAIEK